MRSCPPCRRTRRSLRRLSSECSTALWVSGGIALLAIPVTFLLIRDDEMAAAVAATALSDPQPEPAT